MRKTKRRKRGGIKINREEVTTTERERERDVA